jgi:hypothetical protein
MEEKKTKTFVLGNQQKYIHLYILLASRNDTTELIRIFKQNPLVEMEIRRQKEAAECTIHEIKLHKKKNEERRARENSLKKFSYYRGCH